MTSLALHVVTAPAVSVVLDAPPVLMASEHSVDYTCGRCATILLHGAQVVSCTIDGREQQSLVVGEFLARIRRSGRVHDRHQIVGAEVLLN